MNPAWEIAALLPDYLPADRVKDAAHRSVRDLPPVRIVKLPGPVRTSYEYTRDLVPKLWDDAERKIDYAVHIGMAGPQLVYQIEDAAIATAIMWRMSTGSCSGMRNGTLSRGISGSGTACRQNY